LTSESSEAIRSAAVSDQEVQLALLTIMTTVTGVDAGAAVQAAFNADSNMAFAPIDLGDFPKPASSNTAAIANQNGLRSVLERLDGFMRLANIAAEVCFHSQWRSRTTQLTQHRLFIRRSS